MANSDTLLDEVADRCRRIETKLTRLAVAQGLDSTTTKPHFDDGRLYLPSPDCSIQDCVSAIPYGWGAPVEVWHKERHITTLPIKRRNTNNG